MDVLAWIILLIPLLTAAVLKLALPRAGNLAALASTGAAGLMLVGAVALQFADHTTGSLGFRWIDLGTASITLGIRIDDLSQAMLLVVALVGFFVHVFSLGYMRDDEGKARYFTGLSLFMFSMSGIVLADNLFMMFIFWELVALSSYILIGHWFDRDSAADASRKAFLTNRVGDFGFLAGILILWGVAGTVDFGQLQAMAATGTLGLDGTLLTGVVLCLFCGAVGKSAQLPLHVWLPDAMEGPTPVSALIHAATMVAAGVYMLARIAFLISLDATAAGVIAWTGGITALFAAVVATQQNDIKRVLAYSTLSQLGYMVMAVGLLAPAAAFFHLFTHAFFKALLFLGAGAVIHACHHQQDMWKLGGLARRMPLTFLAFAVGTAALCAFPWVTAGFFSKEAILEAAHHGSTPLFLIAAVVAFLTPFYMVRLIVVTFLGKPRDKAADQAIEAPPVMLLPLAVLAFFSVVAGWGFVAGPMLGDTFPKEHASFFVLLVSLATLAGGAASGWFLYRGRDADPVNLPVVRHKFFIDEIYHGLIKVFQDGTAALLRGVDRYVVDGLLVGGAAAVANGLGAALRILQSGSLQLYSFIVAFGILLLWWVASGL